MATIIDFSPTALEIDEIASAAQSINPNIPPPLLPTASTSINPATDANLANTFTGNSPDILFVAEYAASGGVLVVWENYYNASHYELFRRNYMAVNDSWQRVLIIDANHLAQETANFTSYITDVLRLNIKSGFYAILDTDVPADQIVEYKVVACYYPTSANINYSYALASQGRLNMVPISGETIFQFSGRMFGTQDYAWLVALMNEGAQFFGRDAATQSLASFTGETVAYLPTTLDVVPQLVQESAYFFGLVPTITNIINRIKCDTVISKFFDDALASISTSDSKFYYATFQNKLYTDYPNYQTLVTAVKNGTAYVGADVFTPTYTDTTGFATFSDLNLMFTRLNSLLIGATFGNDAGAALLLPKPVPKDLLPPAPPKNTLPNLPKIAPLLTQPIKPNPFAPFENSSPFGNAFNNGFL